MKLAHPAFRLFLLCVGFLLWLILGYFPAKRKQAILAGRQLELEARLAHFQKLAPKIPLWQVRETELEKSVSQLVANLPTPAQAQKFLDEMMALSEKEGLKVLDARPTFFELLSAVRDMDSTRPNLIRPVSFSLRVEGGYGPIATIAQRIEALPSFRGFFLTEAVKGQKFGTVEATLVFYAYMVINPKAGA